MAEAPKCASEKCGKTVYPMEELKALDKVYHKACFRCYTCSTLLNIKNFCGYNKEPYCRTHYPKDKHTVVLDTPDNNRARDNTKMQSKVEYHKEYEKQKGKSGSAAAAAASAPVEEAAAAPAAAE